MIQLAEIGAVDKKVLQEFMLSIVECAEDKRQRCHQREWKGECRKVYLPLIITSHINFVLTALDAIKSEHRMGVGLLTLTPRSNLFGVFLIVANL